jgi:hypothetical protein
MGGDGMATMTGTVSCLQVFDDGSFVQVVDAATGAKEAFTLWFAPPEVSAFERIMQSMWVSLLRQSLVSGIPVTINAASSGLVNNVQLGTLQ